MKHRTLRRGELTLKDMGTLREADSAKVQHSKTSGSLRDYSLRHLIKMGWGFNEDKRDLLPFKLFIDGHSYTLSWAELRDLDRDGFFRREEGQPSEYRLRYFDGKKLTLDTGLNEEAKWDMIVRLVGKNCDAVLDWYQVLRLGRFI